MSTDRFGPLPEEQVIELLERNRVYAEQFHGTDVTVRPRRRLAVLTCMDARLDVHRLLGLELGEAHVIRNAGGLVTDDATRSILLSQRMLGTEEVIVVQHTDCGMLKLSEPEMRDQIRQETGIDLPFALGAFADLEKSVRDNVTRLRESRLLLHRDRVRGFIFAVETGLLQEVPPD